MQALWMIVATALFAGMGACVKLAAELYGTFEIVFYRGLVGCLLLGAWVALSQRSLATNLLGAHLARGAVGVTSLCLWFYAIGSLPLPTAITLNYTSPLFLAALALIASMTGRTQPLDGRLLVGIMGGFAGVLLILRPSFQGSEWPGAVAGLASGLISAIAYMMVRRLGHSGEPEWRIVFYFSLMGCLAGLAGSLLFSGGLSAGHSREGFGYLVGIGVLATAAQLALTRAFGKGRALLSANLQYLGIVHAILLDRWLFGDAIDIWTYSGIFLIIASGVQSAVASTRNAGHTLDTTT